MAGFREKATLCLPIRTQPWAAAAQLESTAAIMTIHILTGASITTIVGIILPAGYSTG